MDGPIKYFASHPVISPKKEEDNWEKKGPKWIGPNCHFATFACSLARLQSVVQTFWGDRSVNHKKPSLLSPPPQEQISFPPHLRLINWCRPLATTLQIAPNRLTNSTTCAAFAHEISESFVPVTICFTAFEGEYRSRGEGERVWRWKMSSMDVWNAWVQAFLLLDILVEQLSYHPQGYLAFAPDED